MNISKSKQKAIAQTLLDCGKILLAALVAADFIAFGLSIKLIIVITMIVVIVSGIMLIPDNDEGE